MNKDNSLTEIRFLEMLYTALGPDVTMFLDDPNVIEIMLNPDSSLWIERLGEGCIDTGKIIHPANARQVIELVARAKDAVATKDEFPIVSAELPGSGHRFEGVLDSVTLNPFFVIRKKAIMVFNLDDYVKKNIMTVVQKDAIIEAVYSKKNILVAGGTGSGKTTLLNAVLNEISKTNDRIVIIEDTLELQCTAKNKVNLRTHRNVTMNDLLYSTMRLRPDRIVVGEVRGPEALTLIKAWNTGHPGGCASVHANSCAGALTRIESLVQEAIPNPSRGMIAEAINIIIYIEKTSTGRQIKEMVSVEGFKNGEYVLKPL
jgi:P-type conjugative transfer ATPase TrbB